MTSHATKTLKKKITFLSGELTLEGILHLVDNPESRPGVVVCHPHPLYGGSMYNNVVIAVCEELVARGITALRFNFRGVGDSQGKYADGIGEIDDVSAALDYLASLPSSESGRIGVAGYSFGAHKGLLAAVRDERVCAVVAISPAIAVDDFAFLKSYTRPKLLMIGEKDEFAPVDAFHALLAEIPEPKRFEIIPFADHFWFGFQRRVGQIVAEFFAEVFARNPLTTKDKCG